MATTRVGTPNNLAKGGAYDLLMIKFVGTFPEGQITFGFYDVPMKVTGIQKVAQTFLKILLTTKGSDPFYPARGTFLADNVINANRKNNKTVFLAEVADFIKDAEVQTRACLNVSNLDASSCLDTATLLTADAGDDSLLISIIITTLAGITASIAVPFPEFGLT